MNFLQFFGPMAMGFVLGVLACATLIKAVCHIFGNMMKTPAVVATLQNYFSVDKEKIQAGANAGGDKPEHHDMADIAGDSLKV